ncbi:MAG TPA: hypothetical protein VF625_14355 [Longimicrobium sp.]
MIKRLYTAAMLALVLAGGSAVQAQAAPLAAAQTVAAAVAPATPVALTYHLSAPATELTSLQMASVEGGFLGSLIKSLFKKVVSAVVGVIVKTVVEFVSKWILQQLGMNSEEEKTDTQTKSFASQAAYDAGIEQSSSYNEGYWQQTYVSYEPTGCAGGSGGTRFYQQEMIQEMSSC